MKDETVNLLKGNAVDFKAHSNYDNKTFSLSTKTPVEALPKDNILRTIASLGVDLTPNTPKKFLAIKNNSTEDITLRLITFNVSIEDAKDVLFELELKDESDVTGTFEDYEVGGVSQYSINPIFTNNIIPDYPSVSTDNFGITVKSEVRLNLIKDDVIVRWGKGKVLCFSALCKNSNSFSFFFRHVEEY